MPGALIDDETPLAERKTIMQFVDEEKKPVNEVKESAEGLAVYRRTGDPVKDSEHVIESLTQELRQLKRALENEGKIPAAIARIEGDIAAEKAKIVQAQLAEKAELERELKVKQQTALHGELLTSIEYQDEEKTVKVYGCTSHPGRQITDWVAHVSDNDMHDEFLENDPLIRRMNEENRLRDIEDEKARRLKHAQETFAEEQRKKDDYMRRNGFRNAGPVTY